MHTGTDYLLIIEDDPDILKLLDATLTFKGYRVITARNGKEGLEAIQVKRPAIVITDIMMPKLDGFGLAHRIRINPETRDIPVVFITATYVAREENLLATEADKEGESLQASLRHAIRERDELKLLLNQIHEQLNKYSKSE